MRHVMGRRGDGRGTWGRTGRTGTVRPSRGDRVPSSPPATATYSGRRAGSLAASTPGTAESPEPSAFTMKRRVKPVSKRPAIASACWFGDHATSAAASLQIIGDRIDERHALATAAHGQHLKAIGPGVLYGDQLGIRREPVAEESVDGAELHDPLHPGPVRLHAIDVRRAALRVEPTEIDAPVRRPLGPVVDGCALGAGHDPRWRPSASTKATPASSGSSVIQRLKMTFAPSGDQSGVRLDSGLVVKSVICTCPEPSAFMTHSS